MRQSVALRLAAIASLATGGPRPMPTSDREFDLPSPFGADFVAGGGWRRVASQERKRSRQRALLKQRGHGKHRRRERRTRRK